MPGPAPSVAATRTAVRAALDLVAPLGPAGTAAPLVLVGCSGGPDSLALAAATAFVAPRSGRRAGAVVVDHGLQPGSAQVAATAAAQCRALGCDPVLVVPVRVDGPGGPEAAARAARHAALLGQAERLGAAAVLLGHTVDDQAEQVLLGLARGSGPRSLAGMPAVRGRFARPFLELSRVTTVAACAELGLRPWQDPTNLVGPGLRSRVRHELLPLLAEVLGPGVPQALARTADQCREAAEVLDGLAAELLVAAGLAVPHGDAAAAPGDSTPTRSATSAIAGPVEAPSWEVAVLAAAPVGVRRAALHRLALTVGAVPGSLSRAHVLALDRLVVEWHGQGPVDLPGGPRLVRECGRLLLARPGTVPAAG